MTDVFDLNGIIVEKYPDHVSGKEGILSFTSTHEEYEALKDGVGIRNISDRNVIALYGKDVLEFLNRLSTNKIVDMPTAGIKGTIFTNEKGRIIDRTVLVGLEGKHLLISSCSCDTRILSWIEKYIVMDDIRTEMVGGQYCMLEFYGRQAESYLTMFCGNSIEQVNDSNLTLITHEDVHFFLFKQVEPSGLEKFMLLSPVSYGKKIIDILLNNTSAFNVLFVGSDAYSRFRIENGIPAYPNELNDSYNPHEANLLCEVNLNKGCYIGQEVIARLDTYDKVQRNLTGIVSNLPLNGETDLLNDSGEVVGIITSHFDLKESDKTIGLAYIRKAFNVSEQELIVAGTDNRIIVKKLPIVL
ncbi:MAG: hypothetical protein KKA84_09400 [Bacteroidetes bacterium]|nr:hypothetical protein [Bacteroidota bacterium]